MRYVWEPQDIIAGRQIEAWNRAERYLIGYDPRLGSDDPRWIIVSLADGMLLIDKLTVQQIISHLNSGDAYRPVAIANGDHLMKAAAKAPI